MSSLIFFIFMIWFIMRIVKNKQKATGQNDPKQTQGSNTPGSAATRTGSTYSTAAGRAKKSAYESAMAFQKTATGSGAGSSSSVWATALGSDGSSSSSTSTTAYLERKAKEDARDHAQEKREEQARLHQETGGRMVGVRYYEWDSIPKGNRVVKCNYCGAENLFRSAINRTAIPAISAGRFWSDCFRNRRQPKAARLFEPVIIQIINWRMDFNHWII